VSADRDLAEAIYAALTSDKTIDAALDVWGEVAELPDRPDPDLLRLVVEVVAAAVIGDLLTLREREPPGQPPGQARGRGARDPSRWDTADRMSDLDRDAIARVLHEAHKPWCDYTYPFEHPMSSREVYEALADAVARWVCEHEPPGQARGARTGPQEEDGYPGSPLLRVRAVSEDGGEEGAA